MAATALSLCRGALSAGPHSRGATKAVVVGADTDVSQVVEGFDVKDSLPPAVDAIDADGVPQLLVEIAIVYLCMHLIETESVLNPKKRKGPGHA